MAKEKVTELAIAAFANNHPNSVITDLLNHFPKHVIIQLIELYSGRQLSIPTVRSIWVSHRNAVISEELEKRNDKRTRMRLAGTFGLDTPRVSMIFSQCQRRGITRVKSRTIRHVVNVIFAKNLKRYNKELRGIFSRQVGIHDELRDPEQLFLLQETKNRLIENCVYDLNGHLLFSGRENKRDEAIGLMLKKINEEL